MSVKLDTRHRVPHEDMNLNSDTRNIPRETPDPRIPGTQPLLLFGTKQENRRSFAMDYMKYRAQVGASLDNADEGHPFGRSIRIRSLAYISSPGNQRVETFADIG
ncbi:hypothetical protein N7516_003012 [Penicillium verrucosum]|uniref:uncharacterized protein n=1 Tax=Penicillium verrucosum TaxID=60171 RepID=UPI0025458591|nr:uncharacterized protein N7516_003012 [Penicillium verrucosum]KAJ5942844.1 hypothetical protein N7516_003012 [Penicillium verrucosum]